MREMKKEVGLVPFGNLEHYSLTKCPPDIAKVLNSRERECLDLHWARFQVACQRIK